MKNDNIQRDFYNKAFKTMHIWKDCDFPESSAYLHDRFLDMVFENKPKNILEIGCGDGLFTFFLLKRPAKITAVDVSDKAIESMRRQFHKEITNGKLKLAASDLISFLEKTDEKFDLIIGSGIIHHIEKEDWDKLYKLAYQKLNPGGIFSCAPEPNAGGLYKICWRFARYAYKLFGIEYDWEVEKGTLNMISNRLKNALGIAGFSKIEILPFQSIPYFHSKILAHFDRLILDKINGKFAMYIILKGERK